MILGIGFDFSALPRIQKQMEIREERFLTRILTEEERTFLPERPSRRVAYVAGRWAAKEAAVKALGTGFSSGIGFHDVEIVTLKSGRPELRLHGKAKEVANVLGVTTTHISISHERDRAGAMVILEG